ncbi:MAG: hydrogenase maturation nickel metallochaperone HypA [Euzebya sp.]
MHEFGYCEGILDAVEQRATGRPVARVKVRIGTTHRIVQESLDTAFAVVAAGSVAEGAAIDMQVTPVTVHCQDCGADSTSLDPFPSCEACGSGQVELEGGDECLLESIELRPQTADAAGAGG